MGDAVAIARKRRARAGIRSGGRRGAALIIVIAIMTILLAIALTFFTNANVAQNAATNVANQARVGFIQDGGTAITQATVNQDFLHNYGATSNDHPWKTLYNGTAFVGKPWARYKGSDMADLGASGTRQPAMPEFNFSAIQNCSDCPLYIRFRDGVVEPLFQGSRSKQWLFIPRYQGPSPATNNHNVLVLYDCVELCDENGTVIQDRTAYLNTLSTLNAELATQDFYIAYYNGPDTIDCLRDTFWPENFDRLPKVTDDDIPFVTTNIFGETFASANNPVIGTNDTDGEYPAQQVNNYADVDNDGDGLNDAIWIPVPIDLYFPDDGVDNNLNGWVDEQQDNGINDDGADESGDMAINDSLEYVEGGDYNAPKRYNDPDEAIESGVFAYFGGNDGLDNDGDSLVDDSDPDENGSLPNRGLFLTSPLPALTFYVDLNADGVAYDLVPDDAIYQQVFSNTGDSVAALRASLKPLRVSLPQRVNALFNGVVVQLGPENVDTIDNDYDLVVNDYSAYCYVGPNTLAQPFRPPFETYFDGNGYFVQTASQDTYNSYLRILGSPAVNIWRVTNIPSPPDYYAIWRAPGNWFQPVPTVDQTTLDASAAFNGPRAFSVVGNSVGDVHLFQTARRKAFIEINDGAFDLDGDGTPDFTFSPRIIHLETSDIPPQLNISYDLNNDPALLNAVHITSSGEPVCEIAGRVAIRIDDVASKVNLNVAGAHTPNDEYPYHLGARYAEDGDPRGGSDAGPVSRASLGEGVDPSEYEIRMIPQVDIVTGGGLWTAKTGSPNGGLGARLDVSGNYSSVLPPPGGGQPDYTFDVSFPGYGRVDDNADALLLSLDARDDNGNGLIDEGLYLPPLPSSTTYNTHRPSLSADAADVIFNNGAATGFTYSGLRSSFTNDAYANNLRNEINRYLEYFNRLGNLEGVDDAREFQITAALRNYVAERDQVDNNVPKNSNYIPLTDENGELGDRVYSDINSQEILERAGFSAATMDKLKSILTTFSTDRNASFVPTAAGAIRALKRLDFNYATAQQIAAALIVQGGFEPATARTVNFEGTTYPQIGKRGNSLDANGRDFFVDTNAFAEGLRRANTNLRAPDPTGNPDNGTKGWINRPGEIRDFSKTGDQLTGGMMFVRFGPLAFAPTTSGPGHEFPADPFLDALQLAANIVDNADRDHARTQLTTENVDSRADAVELQAVDSWPRDTDLNNRERIRLSELFPTEDIENYIKNVLGFTPRVVQAVDTWWEQYVFGATNATGTPRGEQRHFAYTAAGSEAIKINEIMVRPVRRVEAEMVRASYPDLLNPGSVIRLTINDMQSTMSSVDPMILNTPFTSVSEGGPANYDPAPGFDLDGDGDFESDPLPDFNLTRQTLLPALTGNPDTWQIDTRLGAGNLANVLGPDIAVSNDLTARRDVSNGTATISVPDVVQFIIRGADVDPDDPFAAPAGLPGGRYYLTISTIDPATGLATVNEPDELDYSIKYVDIAGIQVDDPDATTNLITDNTILGDIARVTAAAASTTDLNDWLDEHFVTVPGAHIAGEANHSTYLEGRPAGWVFLDGTPDSIPSTSSEFDYYFVDGGEPVPLASRSRNPLDPAVRTHTVYVPEPGSPVALCIAFKRKQDDGTGNPQPKISINFFDFQQQPDHEYVEVANTSQNAISMDGWKLEIGIPKPKDTQILDDPHKSIWEVPKGTTIAPGGMLLFGFDVFDGFQETNGQVWRDSSTGTDELLTESIGHNGMGLASWQNTGGPSTPFDAFANVTAPPIRDVSYLSPLVDPALPFAQMFEPTGRFADVTGSVFTRALDIRFGGAFDYVDRDGDGLSSYALSSDDSVTFATLTGAGNSVPRQALYSIDAIADDTRLENGVILSTDPNADPEHNLINALGNVPNKPWDRLVQLKCVQIRRGPMVEEITTVPQNDVYNKQRLYPDGPALTLANTTGPNEVDYVADMVLRGGFLPDYPEHDGYDNDGDGGYYIANDQSQCAPATPLSRKPFQYDYVPGTLDKDMVDNDLNGIIDERAPGINFDADIYGCLDPNTVSAPPGFVDVIPDLTLSEGVDEGNLFRVVDDNLFAASKINPSRQYGAGSFEAGLLPAIFFNNRALYPSDVTFLLDDPSTVNPYLDRYPKDPDPCTLPVQPVIGQYVGISDAYDLTGLPCPLPSDQASADQRVTRLGAEEAFLPGASVINGFEEATYLGSDLDPPDWKAFTERRWNPGDNVIVSLYDDEGDLVDRATYREYDVINRTIDDVAPCPYFVDDGNGRFDAGETHLSLVPEGNASNFMPIDGEIGLAAPYPGLPSVWRPNQMGLDFYRSLERKDPDYPGDLYGTSNRWEPTDGNYDDWADSMPLFRALQTTNEAGEAEALPRIDDRRMTPRFVDPIVEPLTFDGWSQDTARLYRHCIWGSPLRMNLASRLLRNPVDLPRLFLVPNGSPAPTSYTVDDYVDATTDRGGVQRTTADERPFGQFPSRGGFANYQGTPLANGEENHDWTLYKAAGADRFSHRDYPNEREYADGINSVLTASTTEQFPAILKAGTAMENTEFPIDNPFLNSTGADYPQGNTVYSTRRGMDEPYRTNADLMRVPMMTLRHDMFNISYAKAFLDTAYPNQAFVAVQDPQGYEQIRTWYHFPRQLISGVLGADETDLDPSHPWAEAAQRNDTNGVFGRDPNNRTRESLLARASDLMSTQPIVLTAGQATFQPIAPAKFEFDSNGHVYPADRANYYELINWLDNPSIPDQATAPEAWSPIFLYELPGDSDDSGPAVPPRKDYFPFYPAYPNGATSETLVDRHYLFLTDFLFPSGPTAPSYFTGKSRYGLPGNVPDYGLNPASLDDKVGARRAPFERRVAMYVAKNQFLNSTDYMSDEDRADAVFVWDQDDGLENGEYIAYVGTWIPGLADRLRAADETVATAADTGVNVPDMQPPAASVPVSNGADVDPLNPDGRPYDSAIRTLLAFEDKGRADINLPRWNPMLQMEFITERVRAQGIAQGGGGVGLLPPAAWQPAVTYTANKNGYIFYSAEEAGAWQPIVVRVTDNFLALRIRNVGKNLDVAAFSHVILAPHKRAAGKINVNTADITPMAVSGRSYLFSSLLGLPGMYNDFEPVAPEADISPNNAPGVGAATGGAPPAFFTNGAAVPPAPSAFGGLNPDNATRATQLTGLIQAGRPVHADGRYYKSTADLVANESRYQYDTADGRVRHNLDDDENVSVYPLSNRAPDPNDLQPPLNLPEQRFEDTAARFAKMANSITVRSDVFEILATVQAGYGLDANGDGRINYRSPDEFVTTAESKSRVVYERRAPSDTSDQSGK